MPVSEVGKHFPNETRTIATGVVTAAASIGYFLSPLLTKYSLVEFEWEQTLKYFLIFIFIGLVVSIFLFPAKAVINSSQADRDQTFCQLLKKHFLTKDIYYSF